MHILFLSDNFPPEINASASRPQALPGGQTIRLLLHGVAGESAEIVEREGVGRVFEPENVDQLVRHLLDMRGDGGERGVSTQRLASGAALQPQGAGFADAERA